VDLSTLIDEKKVLEVCPKEGFAVDIIIVLFTLVKDAQIKQDLLRELEFHIL
jgi:hypothetical protein